MEKGSKNSRMMMIGSEKMERTKERKEEKLKLVKSFLIVLNLDESESV